MKTITLLGGQSITARLGSETVSFSQFQSKEVSDELASKMLHLKKKNQYGNNVFWFVEAGTSAETAGLAQVQADLADENNPEDYWSLPIPEPEPEGE
jgi:hypothetical protein